MRIVECDSRKGNQMGQFREHIETESVIEMILSLTEEDSPESMGAVNKKFIEYQTTTIQYIVIIHP